MDRTFFICYLLAFGLLIENTIIQIIFTGFSDWVLLFSIIQILLYLAMIGIPIMISAENTKKLHKCAKAIKELKGELSKCSWTTLGRQQILYCESHYPNYNRLGISIFIQVAPQISICSSHIKFITKIDW